MGIEIAKSVSHSPIIRSTNVTRNRGIHNTPSIIQANGNAGRHATAHQLMMNEPAYVVWHMGTVGAAGPTIDGVELPLLANRVNICAEVLDRSRRRINRRIQGIFSIHNGANYGWGPIADSTDHLKLMKHFTSAPAEADRSVPYHYGCDNNADALDDSSEHYSTWWSGEQGYFLVGWNDNTTGEDDSYYAHLTINGITYASPRICFFGHC